MNVRSLGKVKVDNEIQSERSIGKSKFPVNRIIYRLVKFWFIFALILFLLLFAMDLFVKWWRH